MTEFVRSEIGINCIWDDLHENEPRRCTPGIRGGIVVEQMIFMAKLTQWLVDC